MMTLLEYVQDILSDMDSDNVNTIGETVESAQVARIVRRTYLRMVGKRDWNWSKDLDQLVGLGDTTTPTKMRMPTDATKVFWIKYNYKDVTWMEPKRFRDLIISRRPWSTSPVDANGYFTDRDPTYWTTFDDDYVWFDSYNSADNDTLITGLSECFVTKDGSWTHTDDFVPRIPAKMQYTLLGGAKASAFSVLKQAENRDAHKDYTQGMAEAQTEADKAVTLVHHTNTAIDFGRRR